MAIMSVVKLLKEVSLWNTLYFNFHYFPFKKAIHIPVFIYKYSELYKMDGKIVIDAPVSTGMVRLGVHNVGTIDLRYSRTLWQVSGTLVIKGKVDIGSGTKISIGKGGTLILGGNFTITGGSEIICHKEITFGEKCLLSWDILIMDTDFHHVINVEEKTINPTKPITIGNHVWIGCRSTILKGVSIADNTIISANSTITRNILESNCVIGGHGKSVEIIKRNVNWTK